VMVRPEQIRLWRADETTPDGTASFDAIVQDVIFQGQDAGVGLQLQSAARTVVRARVPGYRTPQPGEHVRLAIDGDVTAYARA
jgi:iron(III) transport system ATP-binding protein